MDDFFRALAFIIVAGGCLVGGLLYGAYVIDRVTCRSQAEAMNVPSSFGLFQRCMIVVDGKTIPLEAYKVIKVQ